MTAQLDLALTAKRRAQRRAACKHGAEIAALTGLMRDLAYKAGRSGCTVGDLRLAAVRLGALPEKGSGRQLSWLAAVPRAAGLVSTGKRRLCVQAATRNDQVCWCLPEYVAAPALEER